MFHTFKDFSIWPKTAWSQREKFTAHYACRNADLNLRLVAAMLNRFIFQIIDPLMQSWGVRLTVTFFTSLRSRSLQLTRKPYRIKLWNCLNFPNKLLWGRMNHLIKFPGQVFPVPPANSKNHFLQFDWQSYYSLKSNIL